MKRCNACDQAFEDKYVFCPSDATPLPGATAQRLSVSELHLTLIDSAGLAKRLAEEIRFVKSQIKLAWPAMKRDPVGFSRRVLIAGFRSLQRAIATPNALTAFAAALLFVFSAVLSVLMIGNLRTQTDLGVTTSKNELAQIVEFPADPKLASQDPGIGAGSKEGRVGFARDRGEGSGPVPRKSSGGGTGGAGDPLPAQLGKPPQPSEIPAPIPKFPPVQKQALPDAGLDIDPLLWKNLPMANYGDPRSQSATPSNGPGSDGGMGTGPGQGIGEGKRGAGFGPGEDGNIGGGPKGRGCCGPGGSDGNNPLDWDRDRVYPVLAVSERARVIAKPEPQYTEEARRNAVSGTVVLRVVFSRTGEVTNIRAVQSLPFGLTERAIAAARLIRFRPATREGHPVNVYMQLEYNFNLY